MEPHRISQPWCPESERDKGSSPPTRQYSRGVSGTPHRLAVASPIASDISAMTAATKRSGAAIASVPCVTVTVEPGSVSYSATTFRLYVRLRKPRKGKLPADFDRLIRILDESSGAAKIDEDMLLEAMPNLVRFLPRA